MDWMDAMVCLAVPPKTLDWEQAQNIASAMLRSNTVQR